VDLVYDIRVIVLALTVFAAGCSSGSDGADESQPPPSPPANDAPSQNVAPPQESAAVSALFVLGDSLSDVGNAAGAADFVLGKAVDPPTIGLCNPADVLVLSRGCEDVIYRKSRVSDGPVAVEHLAMDLGFQALGASFHVVPNRPSKGGNYAVASAKARGPGAEDLARQVDVLLLDQAKLPTTALVVVMIGGNDAIDALQAVVGGGPSSGSASTLIVSTAVAAIGDGLERLLDFGARRLVVANVPDLASLPSVQATARSNADPAAVLAAAAAVSESFNQQLAARLDQIASKRAWDSPQSPVLVRFDLRAALEAARQAASGRGNNTTDACFDSEAYRDSSLAERTFHANCKPLMAGSAPRFDEFVFWDGIHPTGVTHAALGAALAAQVKADLRL
jgi:phospholipase/lecithinase/hemolysin